MASIAISDLSVLLVEPSRTQSKAITATLNQAGITKVETATSVNLALLTMESYIPDLVISAMYFEHGTGTDLVTIIRNDSKLSEVPFILISSAKNHDVLDPVKQAGVVAILPKPFRFASLKKALFATLDFIEPDKEVIADLDIDSYRILVVDDSTLARNQIKRVLKNLGASTIIEAADGLEAVALMKEEIFDLVVTDYNMPNMDGNELVEYIRNESGHAGIPVMMVTSEKNNARLGSIEQDGFSVLCDKPFEPRNVKALLQSIIN